jgi:hypothetical protein
MSFWDWKSACTIVQRVPASSLKKNRKKSVRKKNLGCLVTLLSTSSMFVWLVVGADLF